MSKLIGRVHFSSSIDGENMPKDAQKMGKQAGLKGGKAFTEAWDKEFREGLTTMGRQQLTHWGNRGKADGLMYGRGLEIEFKKFSARIMDAFDAFQGLSVDADFLDDFKTKGEDAEKSISKLREQMGLLHRAGAITDVQFRNANSTMDKWVATTREAEERTRALVEQEEALAEATRRSAEMAQQHARARQNLLDLEYNQRSYADAVRDGVKADHDFAASLDRVDEATKKASLSWKGLSHNTRQWTLIIGAVTAALPELAGLSSAAGSGLLTLGGALAGAGVGAGTLVAGIVGLNEDLEDLPASLRGARAGFDDFKDSFSDLNEIISVAMFEDSERAWRSLGSTVRGLGPAFDYLGGVIGDTFDDFAAAVAPGTKNFENLQGLVRGSAPIFDGLARAAGRLGEGLLAAFNDPAMEQSMGELVGYIDTLTDRFATFLEGPGLDQWLAHGREVFGAFGDLLDTTGRMLNDLVTPASIQRLTDFMDNIGTFLDTGGRGILEFADELNVFGLAADLLAKVGEALEPLREPMTELAAAVNDKLIDAFTGLAGTLEVAATVAAPFVSAIADLVDAIPPELATVIGGIATATIALNAALKAFGAVTIVDAFKSINTEGGKAATTIGKVGKAAGLIGAGVVGVMALAEGFEALGEGLYDIDDKARNFVATSASIEQAFGSLVKSGASLDVTKDNISDILDRLGDLDNFWTYIGALDEVGTKAVGLATTLQELDGPMATLANASVPAAAEQFAAYAAELGATDAQVLGMLENMPQLKEAFLASAEGADGLATDQELLNVALGRGQEAASANTEELKNTASAAGLTGEEIDDLASKIRGFADEALNARDADRQFEQAIDDLTAAAAENGATLDINTRQGRNNEAAIDDLAQATHEMVAATLERTGSEDDARSAMERGRQKLIEMVGQFGITGDAAQDYADGLGLIPDDVKTKAAFQADFTGLYSWQERLNAIPRSIITTVSVQQTGGTAPRATATGGMFYGAEERLIGEAGPEAVVPFNRPLSQVDPDVRWLSAIAQGKALPGMMGGDSGRPGVVFESGAITATGYFDPRAVVVDLGREIAERITR